MTPDDAQLEDPKQAYREAYESWQVQLERLHAFLLEGERLKP